MSNYINGKPQGIMLSEICNILNGTPYGVTDREISKVSHIKRTIEEGSLFFAFQTWRVDTYSNIFNAMEKKVAAIVTEKRIVDYPCIVVQDSHQAFMDLCAWYRERMNIDVIAITGSIGKTSTKEMVACVLENAFCTEKNQENANSSDLAAMNIMNLQDATEKLVQEVAMQDIHSTSMAIQPTISVITNIGYSHVESFGSRENIFKEKIKILDGMNETGIAVLNIDDDMLAKYALQTPKRVITYAINNMEADVRAENICKYDGGYRFDIVYKGQKCSAKTSCPGKHNILNALAAFVIGELAEMDWADIIEGIACFQPKGYRQNIFVKKGVTVFADCFNAAPDSVKGALDTLESMEVTGQGKRIAVLGDMLELGVYSKELHEEIGNYLNDKNIDMVILYGQKVKYTGNCIVNKKIDVRCAIKRSELIDILKKEALQENSIVLFKGSHGMELEGVIDELFDTRFSMPFYENKYVHERLKREKRDVAGYFRQKNYKCAAIYGISVDESDLITMLRNAGVEVKYAIDRKSKYIPRDLYEIPVFSLEDELEAVDMVFVSLRTYDDELLTNIQSTLGADVLTYKKLMAEIVGIE